ncbi:MAG: hypothetical protein LBR36_09965 [Bacteroidales bacterium]|jgi:hypothetical protein|nr:hypothetical protein [Bacteroidales bacterium]
MASTFIIKSKENGKYYHLSIGYVGQGSYKIRSFEDGTEKIIEHKKGNTDPFSDKRFKYEKVCPVPRHDICDIHNVLYWKNYLETFSETKCMICYDKVQEHHQIEWRKKQNDFPQEKGKYRKKYYEHILPQDKRTYNLFPPIRKQVDDYHKSNNFEPQTGVNNLKSSYIACFNHLFALRNDKSAVLKIAQTISAGVFDIKDVLKIPIDKGETEAFIAFEVISSNDLLNEKTLTRGHNCTSIDALILAKDIKSRTIMLLIEWKYTEKYGNSDKSIEDNDKKSANYQKGDEATGKERLWRYSTLISQSQQLKLKQENYRNSVYFFEPFYQLMRQTLWAEQMIAHKATETIKADDFLHVHVIPKENTGLLYKKYRCSGKEMEETWRDCLIEQNKYQIISPERLLNNIDKTKYEELIAYLSERY